MATIIKNADIYTMDEKNPKADCIVIEGKNISFVGAFADAGLDKYADAQVYDAGGRFMMPGVVDSHIHPGWIAKSMWHVRLPWTEDVKSIRNPNTRFYTLSTILPRCLMKKGR